MIDNSNPIISDVRVAQAMPELVAVLDQLVASTRTLIDASFGAETLFKEQFKERLQMVHLKPSPRGDLFVTSGLLIDLDHLHEQLEKKQGIKIKTGEKPFAANTFAGYKNQLMVLLESNAETLPTWRIVHGLDVVAEKKLVDRSPSAKYPNGVPLSIPDQEWMWGKGALALFNDPAQKPNNGAPQLVNTAMSMSMPVLLKEVLTQAKTTVAENIALVESADFRKRIFALKQAAWAGAFAKSIGAVARSNENQKIMADVGALLGRVGAEAKKMRPK